MEVTEQLVGELNGKLTTLQETVAAQKTTIAELENSLRSIKALAGEDPVKTISEMRNELNELRNAGFKAEFERVVSEFVAIPNTTDAGKSLREYVEGAIGGISKFKTVAEVAEKLATLKENSTYKMVAKALIAESQGGSIVTADKSEAKTEEITSESARAVAARWGVK